MPQRRASRSPLKNCTLYFAFGDASWDFRKALELVARDAGARVASSSRTRGVSHVIVPSEGATSTDDMPVNVPQVSTKWLIDAAERGTRPDEREYSRGPAAPKPSSSGSTSRSRSTSLTRSKQSTKSKGRVSQQTLKTKTATPPASDKHTRTKARAERRRSSRGAPVETRTACPDERVVLAVSAVDDTTRTRAEELQSRLTRARGKRGAIEVLEEGKRGITHIVVGTSRRTQKFLLAVAGGAWVLTPEWLRRCAREKRLVPEGSYEVNPDESPLFAGAVAARKAGGGLFRDFSVCIGRLGSQDPLPRDELVALVEAAGGSVATEPGGADAYVLGRAGQRNRGFMPDPRDSDAECPDPVKLEWLLDSISAYQRLPQASYSVDVSAEKKLVDAKSKDRRTTRHRAHPSAATVSDDNDSDAEMAGSAKPSPARQRSPPSKRGSPRSQEKQSPESDVHMAGTSRPASPQWEEASSSDGEDHEAAGRGKSWPDEPNRVGQGKPDIADKNENARSRSSSVSHRVSSHDELGIVSVSHELSQDELPIVSVDSSMPANHAIRRGHRHIATHVPSVTASPISPEPPLYRRRRTFLRTPPSGQSKRSSPSKSRDTPIFHAPTPPDRETGDGDADSIEVGATPPQRASARHRKRSREEMQHASDDPISDEDHDSGHENGSDTEGEGQLHGASTGDGTTRARRLPMHRISLQRPAKKPFVPPRSTRPLPSGHADVSPRDQGTARSSPNGAVRAPHSPDDASQRPDGYTDVTTLDRNAASQVSLDLPNDDNGYSSESQTF